MVKNIISDMKRVVIVFTTLLCIFDVCWAIWMLFGGGVQINWPTTNLPALSFIDIKLSQMTLREKISSLLILHTPGTDVSVLKDYLSKYQPGGLIFMVDNIPGTTDELKSLTQSLQNNKSLPYLFAVDEEGGIVKRLPQDDFAAAIELKNQPISATQGAFKSRSLLLQQSGLNLNFGIVADVTADQNSFIYPRVFGGDLTQAGERVSAAVTASKGITLSTLKHFPGHGESEADSHNSIPTTDISLSQWQLRDMIPFKMGVDTGADVVMFGHLIYSSIDDAPASLSLKWHDILKNSLGFKGMTVTDDMIMLQNSGVDEFSNPINNAIRALNAGNTMLLYVLGPDNSVSGVNVDDLIDGIVKSVIDGDLKLSLINQNARKVIEVKRALNKRGSP